MHKDRIKNKTKKRIWGEEEKKKTMNTHTMIVGECANICFNEIVTFVIGQQNYLIQVANLSVLFLSIFLCYFVLSTPFNTFAFNNQMH